ncbi:uncharacterized protein M421DRAFT_387704 [Didymella exigua CBS 183.55]|uniref:F-box domain-containing protein n=1 Tax=Didymella exigua CBS 183.55 TaxID=1150837 RepID=A0A6A5R662_9PLEO|nr:uncharacterized protein M421DRAFT_387704 [Didymella exigua CBS 183.55]KAF1922216.1 hypothetical protein M421DRAFT_387704 [Didymella exigua CBS 183.55]
MGLLDLPPEIIDYILDFAGPAGLESFVLTCKAVYERATTQIHDHNYLRRRWRHTNNQSNLRRGDTLSVLHEISRNPIIAEYIETLSLWDRRSDEEIQSQDVVDSFRDDGQAMQQIKALLRDAEFFRDADLEDWWIEIVEEDQAVDIESIDKLYATVALLTLLPNLKTLQLPDRWHEVRSDEAAESLVPSVESLVTMSNVNTYRRRWQALQSLETIMPFTEEGYDVRVGLQCLQPFMALNSVRNLYAVSCVAVDDEWGGIPFHWPYASFSPLTRLEFASCCMDAHGLDALLAHTPAVTTFKYSHQTKWDSLQHDWNPGEFLQTLANRLGKQLLDLALTVDELHGDVINGLSSFHSFAVLRKLEVDVIPFCGPPLESGQRLGRDAFVPEGAEAWTHGDIPCLGDMLPSSIREVHLNTDYPLPSEQSLKSLVKNVVDRRKDNLRHLERCIIRQYRSNTAQFIADRHDITLEVFDMDMVDPRARAMMPLWKREFDRKVGGIVTGLSSGN